MKALSIFLLLSVLLAFGCQQKEITNSDLEVIKVGGIPNDTCNISTVFNKGEIIKLETSDSCFISHIAQLLKSDKYLFVSDSWSRVLQFDSLGNFIRQIGRQGRGPKEYSRIMRIMVDNTNDCIIVNDRSKFIWFDFDGEFIREEALAESREILEFADIAEGYLYTVKSSYGPESEEQDPNRPDFHIRVKTMIYKYDHNFQLVDSILFRDVVYPVGFGVNSWPYYISNLNSGIYFYYSTQSPEPLLRDTLFRIEQSKVTPVLKTDFSEDLKVRNVTNDQYYVAMQSGKSLTRDIRNITINNVYRTENYVFVEFDDRKTDFYWYCYDRAGEKGYRVKAGFYDDYYGTDSLATVRPLDLKNNLFYFYKEGYEAAGIIDGVVENSNPVLFMLDTKE